MFCLFGAENPLFIYYFEASSIATARVTVIEAMGCTLNYGLFFGVIWVDFMGENAHKRYLLCFALVSFGWWVGFVKFKCLMIMLICK